MKKRENKAKKKWKLRWRWRREKRNFEFYRFFMAVYTNKYKNMRILYF